MKTPITYYGGKQSLASVIISNIPEHTTYCEPFFGGGAVFFAKKPSQVEIINDLNQEVINFYRQAKNNFQELLSLIESTLHSRREYKDAIIMYQNPHLFSEVERAWAFYTATNQGYTGKIGTWAFGTVDCSVERRVLNGKLRIKEIAGRLDKVQIECNDALYLLKLRDRPTTFFYLDPPYFNSQCGHYGGYTEADFGQLLEACSKIEGKFLLSSYPSEILNKFVNENDWHQIHIDQVTRASRYRK